MRSTGSVKFGFVKVYDAIAVFVGLLRVERHAQKLDLFSGKQQGQLKRLDTKILKFDNYDKT